LVKSGWYFLTVFVFISGITTFTGFSLTACFFGTGGGVLVTGLKLGLGGTYGLEAAVIAGSGFFASCFLTGTGSDFGFITDFAVGGGTDFLAVTCLFADLAAGTGVFAAAGLAAGFTAFLGAGFGAGFFATGFLTGADFPALGGAGLAGAFFAGLAAFFLTAILVILFL